LLEFFRVPVTLFVEHVNLLMLKRNVDLRPAIAWLFCCLLVLQSISAAEKAHAGITITRYGGGEEIARNVASSFDAGDSYRTPAGRRSLKRIAGLVAITPRPGASAPQISGYSVESQTASGPVVLAIPDKERKRELAERDQLNLRLTGIRQMNGIASANAVFMDPQTGRRLILAQSVIVKLKDGSEAKGWLSRRAQPTRPLGGTTDQFLISMASASAEEIFQEVNVQFDDPDVEWAEPDTIGEMVKHLAPNDPFFPNQWHLNNIGQGHGTTNADVNAVEAWDVTSGSPRVVIAILDDSVEINHPDLSANIFQNGAEIANGVDDDGNGYIDDLRGWDFVNNDNDPSPVLVDDAHGVACAGVAAAVANNGQGVAGAAFNCRILPVRMFGVPNSTLAQSIYYAAGRASDGVGRWRGADVISISLGLPQSTVATAALAWAGTNGRGGKGCPIFVASGNSASRWLSATLDDIPAGTHTYEWVYRKDASISAGADTVWLDGVTFPDGTGESFEAVSLPGGWTTFGNANWFTVQNNVGGNHGLTGWSGANARAARAGDIGDNQTSGLRVTKTTGGGAVSFRVWVSAEFDPTRYFDYLEFRVDGIVRFRIDDDPTIAPDTTIGYPANLTNVMAVGASTDFDFRADYSCYGPELAFVTPSGGGFSGIWTTDRTGLVGYEEGDYSERFSGTSSACPLAAGVAGLVLNANTNLSSRNVRRLMQATCDKIGNVTYTGNTNLFYGWGRINAARALSNAVPRIISLQTNAGNVVLRFPSVLGWTYNLERAASLSGPWAAIQSNIAGTGSVLQLNDARVTTPTMRRHYRLRVLP
jgi:subtilisin family serine protease